MLFTYKQRGISVLLLSWTARAQEEHFILPLRLIRSLSLPSAHFWHRPQHRICCLMHIVYHVCICIFACCYFFLTHQSAPFPAQWHHLAADDSFSISSLRAPFLWLRKHPKTALTVCFCVHLSLSLADFLPHTFTACLSLNVPSPPSLPSFFTPSLCSSLTAPLLRSAGGAKKTKIWFSGSDLDFLQIGWKIRRSFYSYTTQSLPLQLQSMTANQRGCSYQHKCAICDKASLCFQPKTMTGGGTQCAEQRSQRN